MDPDSKLRAEYVFADFPNRSPPNFSNAFRPSNDEHLLIQPRKLSNPVLESKPHSSMQKELKMNNKLGINVLNQKPELVRVFQERQRGQFHQTRRKQEDTPPKSELDLVLERRRKSSQTEPDRTIETSVPEFVQMKEKLRKC